MEQGTSEWFKARSGKITSSELHIIMTGTDYAKEKYMNRILEELGGKYKTDNFYSIATAHGKKNEPVAIELYERLTGVTVHSCGFINSEYPFFGGSPDGLISDNGIIEVKCPHNQENHMQTLVHGMPEKHMAQVQGNLLVTGREYCDFISFDPRQVDAMKIHIERIERDEQYIDLIRDKINYFWVTLCERVYF